MPAVATKLMTTEELLALPDDGVRRWLIRGQLREEGMTRRNRFHIRSMTRVAKFLDNWLDEQPKPRGTVLSGEAGIRLKDDPDTTIGADVVYISAELLAKQTSESTIIDGVPDLIAEVLSPSTKQAEIDEKIDEYLAAGVKLVWVLNPHRRTVMVYRPGGEDPTAFTSKQDITAEDVLPGFRVQVANLFD